jgi:negative elongation factor C/D
MTQSGVVDRLVSVMSVPVVSMGVLHWLEVLLTSPESFSSTPLHICFPSLLRILKASIKLHVAQWPIAFGVLVTSLRLHADINPVKALELKRETLRCMVFMITSGYVLPVLEFVCANTLELDQALLRNFVAMLFARIAPPFSPKFAVALTKILTHPKVQTAIKSCPPESKLKLRGFVGFCQKNPAVLSSDQLHALTVVQEGRD